MAPDCAFYTRDDRHTPVFTCLLCRERSGGGPYRLLGRETGIDPARAAGTAHRRHHHGGLDAPRLQQGLVQALDEVHEGAVLAPVLIQVPAITTLDEGIDDAA